jgi:hypothetical protein
MQLVQKTIENLLVPIVLTKRKKTLKKVRDPKRFLSIRLYLQIS